MLTLKEVWRRTGRDWGFCSHLVLLSPWLGNVAGMGENIGMQRSANCGKVKISERVPLCP